MSKPRVRLEITKRKPKRFVRADEGAELYSLGMTTFRKLAEEAGAVYKVNKRVLVNTVEFEENLQKYRM